MILFSPMNYLQNLCEYLKLVYHSIVNDAKKTGSIGANLITWVLYFYPELFKTLLQCLARNLKHFFGFCMNEESPVSPVRSRISVKLVFPILFGSALSACYLLKPFSKKFRNFSNVLICSCDTITGWSKKFRV